VFEAEACGGRKAQQLALMRGQAQTALLSYLGAGPKRGGKRRGVLNKGLDRVFMISERIQAPEALLHDGKLGG
jgi:hypothetical protein